MLEAADMITKPKAKSSVFIGRTPIFLPSAYKQKREN